MRKLGKWLKWIALALCVLLVAILVSAEAALNAPLSRSFLRDQIQKLAGPALNARLEIDSLDSISLSHARVSGVRLIDRKGRIVATVARADVTLNAWALLAKRLRLPTLSVWNAYVDLGAPGEEGGGGLLGLLAENATTKEPPADDEGGLHIDMPRVRLAHSQVDVRLGKDRLSAREIDTDVGVDVGDEVAIDVRKLRSDLLRDQHALATVQRVKGRWASTGATKAALDVVLATGATLNANAELGAEHQADGQAEQSLLAEVHARGITAQTLAQLGVDAEWLTNKADTTVTAKGTTRGFDYTIGIEAAPLATARASGHATLPSPADQTAKLLLAIERGQYQGTALPSVDARARWNAEHGLAIEHLKASYAKAELTAHGQVSPNGAVALIAHIKSSALDKVPPLHAALPDLSGALDANIDFTRGDGGAMQAKVQLTLQRPALAETRAERIAITGLVRGSSEDDLHGNIQIDATAVHAGQVDVPHATIAIAGSPRRAAANGRFGDKGHFDLIVVRNESVITGDANAHLVVDGKGNVLHAIVRGLRYDKNGAISVKRAAARYQNAHLELAGLFDPKRDSKLALSLDATNLQPVTAAWVETPLVGEVHLDVKARGKLQTPHIEVDASYENDTMLGDRHMPTRIKFSGEFNLDRTPKAPVFETKFDAELLFRNDLGPLKLAVRAKYADSRVDLKLDAQDSRGPLVRTHVQTGFEHTGFKSDASGLSKLLKEHAWQAELWVGARRIDELPGVRSIDVPKVVWPAKISADAKFAHEPGKEPEGKLTANLVWDPPGREEGVITCGMARRPELQVTVDMRNGDLHAQLDASVDKRQMLTVGTDSKAPIDEWLQASVAKVQPASVYVELKDLRLQDLPIVCEHATGYVTGRANLKRAMLDKVESEVDLHAREVTFVGAPPFDAEIAGRADRQMLIGSAKLHAKTGDATVAAKLPLDASGRLPTLSFDEPAEVDINLRHIDARALLGAVSAVRTTGGEFKGQIGMRGNLSSPTFQGTLEMKEVSVTLAEAGQRFERVTGKVALDGRHLHLYPTTVHDRDGSVEVTGDATVIDLTTWQAELTAKAKRFRVRRSGVILALFDGKVGLTATVDPKKETALDVTIDDARVELTGESMSGVQALDPHEDIEFVDDLPQPEKLKQEARRATPVILQIRSKTPFWVRREDFSALVSTQLRIEVRDGNSNLSGPVDIERGYVELMGQMFDIEQGRIQFTGGRNVEPTLDLVAKRRRPGGQTVTIKASGPLYDPQLTFMIEGQTVTAGEALAEATGAARGNGSGADVQNQVSSMATGIAGSVLTLGARRELGDWVPVLALEQSGAETRVRAGVEAGRFIPKFLRKVVVDAYVEGIIQSTDTTDQPNATAARSESAVQAEPGVLLELRFPRHLVGEAQYGPGEVWSLDLSWQP